MILKLVNSTKKLYNTKIDNKSKINEQKKISGIWEKVYFLYSGRIIRTKSQIMN